MKNQVNDTEYWENEIALRTFVSKNLIQEKKQTDDNNIVITKYYIPKKNILDLFKINLVNHRKARLALHYHLRIQPSEIDNMDYMDFEFLLLDLNELLKEKNDAEKKAYGSDKESASGGTTNYQNQMKNMSNFKMPKVQMPKMGKL